MLRSSLYTAGALLACTSAFAQTVNERDLSRRMLPITAPIHHLEGRLDLRTGQFQRTPVTIGDDAKQEVYDNTCAVGFYFGLYATGQNPGGTNPEEIGDYAGIPSTAFTADAFCTVGCADSYDITAFELGWCVVSTPVGGGVMTLKFWDVPQQSCQTGTAPGNNPIGGTRPPSSTTVLSATITGLPRAATAGVVSCYTLTLTLTTPGFNLAGGASLAPGSVAGDKWAWAMGMPSTTGADGPILAGNLSIATPCTPCEGTLWEAAGQTTNAGTGAGQDNHVFFEEYGGTNPVSGDCYFFGGAGSVIAGTHLELFADKPCITGVPTTSFCDLADGSSASCPCANPGNPGNGCDSPIPIMQGGGTTGGIHLAVIAQESSPTNSATVTGTGYPPASTPGAVVIRAAALDSATPVVFGDGLRCIGTPLTRLAGAIATAGTSTHIVGHGAMAGTGTFFYQLWYRSQPASYCDPVADYNLSQGQTLTWPVP